MFNRLFRLSNDASFYCDRVGAQLVFSNDDASPIFFHASHDFLFAALWQVSVNVDRCRATAALFDDKKPPAPMKLS